MSCMFYGCSSLSSLPDISKWNTNNVTYMFFMFSECHNLIISERTKRKHITHISNFISIPF